MVKRAAAIDRIGPKTFDLLEGRLNLTLVRISQLAGDHARAEKRTTVLPEDVEAGLDAVLGGGGLPTPDSVFALVDRLSTDDLVALINRIQSWLQEHASK